MTSVFPFPVSTLHSYYNSKATFWESLLSIRLSINCSRNANDYQRVYYPTHNVQTIIREVYPTNYSLILFVVQEKFGLVRKCWVEGWERCWYSSFNIERSSTLCICWIGLYIQSS